MNSCKNIVKIIFQNSVSFVPPTPKSGGIIVCSVKNTTIIACGVQIYVASKTGLVPLVTMSASDDIGKASTVGPTVRQDLFQGVDNVFTSYVTIKGRPQDMNGHYVCITATDSSNSTMNDTTCYQLKFDLNGGLNPMPQVHFVEPAPQTDSTFVCYINERCSVILYTNNVTKCEHVVSAGVKFTVFAPLDNKDGRCVTEVMISTETIDDFTGCFRSTESNYEERCFQFSIIDKNTDPCASSGDIIHGYCQNHGICFTTGRTDYQCFCNGEGYTGKNCSKGPCVPEDNKCSTNGYCITDDHVITCMCKNGFTGDTCDTDIGGTFAPSITDGARFINTGKPKEVNCNRNFLCGTYAIVGGSFNAGERPVVNVGYVSPELEIKDFKTISQNSSTTLFQTFVTFMPKEEGTFDLCLQTLNNARVNKDETCFVVRVTEGTDTVYGILDHPHFVHPSLQPDSTVECKAGTECHVMYTVTPGNLHSQECIDFKVEIPETEKSHVFTTCRPCVDGNVSNHECTIDIAIRPANDSRVCLSLQIATSGLKGEERCFSVSTIPALNADKKGCQLLECQNDGFCDGHDPTHPMCYCRPGFSGRNCQTDMKIPNGGCQNTFMSGHVTTEIECSFENCTYPFQACRDSSVAIKSGFVSPQLDVYIPFAVVSSPTTCECKTVTSNIESFSTGRFSFCLQLTDANGFVHDEICPNVVVKGADAKNEVAKDKPYFITPTLPTGSSILCEVTSACQLTVYYTDGATFGSSQECPSLKQTSSNLLDGLHIFPPTHVTRECKNAITYQPQTNLTAGETRSLCLTVAVPGKQGEERCYRLKFVNNKTDEVPHPCKGVNCFGDAVCVADLQMKSGTCVCPPGYISGNCSTVYNTTRDLPGVINFTEHTHSPCTPHFDPTHAIAKKIACILGTECVVPISYTGLQANPPIKGFCNSTLSVGSKVVSPDPHNTNYHELLVNVSGSEGEYKCCYQTTVNGTTFGMNIDEICFLIAIQKLDQGLTTIPKNTSITRPNENSTFICLPDVSCHLTIASQLKDGNCEPIKECGDGILGAHVFETHLESDGQCVTDVAYTSAGMPGLKDLCIKPERGAEEYHVFLDVQNSTGFGPCQKLHCKNGGTCMSEEFTPTCACKPGYTGRDCDSDIDECANSPCQHNGTCLDGQNNYTCRCARAYTGGNCEIDIVTQLCTNVPCYGNAVCKTDHQIVVGACICPIGFVGEHCSEAYNSTKDLVGVTNFTQPPNAPDTPHFDSTHGIIKQLECIEGQKCIAPISYNGLDSKPPLKGYCNITATDVVKTPNPNSSIYHELLIDFSGGVGFYKCCYQTTLNGSADGINVDEICFNVKIKPNDPSATSSPTDVQFIRPMANTTFICLPNATCHVTIATPTQNGTCVQISECNTVLPSTHIELLSNANGECFIDIGYTTNGLHGFGDLCLTSGQGRERHVFFDVLNSTEFGPCQKLHCQNGGKCISQDNEPQCTCNPGWTGETCSSDVDECAGHPCINGGTCQNKFNNYTCECAPGYTGQNCTIDIVAHLCENITCSGNGVCKSNHQVSAGACVCKPGFVGKDCSQVYNSTKDLPGVTNYTNFTQTINDQNTPHFDSTHGILKNVECIEGHECIVSIPYYGLPSKPPQQAFCNGNTSYLVESPDVAHNNYHELLVRFLNGAGLYKCCYQTTINGSENGTNVDEICFDVNIKNNDPSATDSPTNLHIIRPAANSTFICLPNATCHFTIATPPQNGTCDQIVECKNRIPNTHIASVINVNGQCLTDIGYTTNGLQGLGDLCLTSRQGGEHHVFVDVQNSTEFGPCQKLHCMNDGKCISQENGPKCSCKPGYTGHDCDTDVDECSVQSCRNGGTCHDEVNNYTCDCTPLFTGRNCQIDIVALLCENITCSGNGFCKASHQLSVGACVCKPGFVGKNCSEVYNSTQDLPGVFNLPQSANATDTPHFDSTHGIIETIECIEGRVCIASISYYGLESKPPIKGFCDLNVTNVVKTPYLTNNNYHELVTNFTGAVAGSYKCCYQTTMNGTEEGINLDEICFDVTMKHNDSSFTASPIASNILRPSANSTFICLPNATCHFTIATPLNNGTCDQISECSNSLPSTYIVPINNANGECLTDIGYTTNGLQGLANLCLTSGQGVEHNIFVDVRNSSEFGPCQKIHCKNGGKCVSRGSGPQCTCEPGFTGQDCGSNVCDPSPCQNGGTCRYSVSTYVCECVSGYTGSNCSIDACNPSPCKNGGTCRQSVNSYTCECVPGYTGSNCSINPNECNPQNNCKHGTCIDGINNYTCNCNGTGFQGSYCERDIDDCISSPCYNGGTCIDGVNSYTCKCILGWEGGRCDTLNAQAIDECVSNPCQNNATCIDGSNNYSCICRPGYTGYNCQNETNKCASGPCKNGAICTDVANGFKCACPPNHPGLQCELDLGGSLNEPRTPNNPNPPRFTEFTIPEIIRCQVNAPCAIVLPVDGDPNTPPVLLTGYYSPGLIVHQPKSTLSYPPNCSNNGKCSYDAFISVKATYVGMFKYCVQTSDYHSVNADELCYQIESFIPQNSHNPGNSSFVQPPTMPNNSTMACPVGKPCLYIIETKKPPGGQCNASMTPEITPDNTMVNLVPTVDNAVCKYDVVFTPAASLNGMKVQLCFSFSDRHCTNVNVNSKEAIAENSGPCSKLHCTNGVCKSPNGTASCRCKPGFTGQSCEKNIEECEISTVPSSITCGHSTCVMDILVTGSQSRPMVNVKSGNTMPVIQGYGSTYTISVDIPQSLAPAEVCFNISARGTFRECAVSACSRVIYSQTEVGVIPVINCTTSDGGRGECNTIVVTTKPLQNGTCPELSVHRDSTLEQVHIFENELISHNGISPHCMAVVSAFTPNGSPQKLCITDTDGNVVCMNTTVSKSVPGNTKCANEKEAGTRAKKQVKTGLVSCVCTIDKDNKTPVEIIKRKPVPPSDSLHKAAGVGAGGMAGAMVVGVIIYLAIKKIKGNGDSETIDVVYKKPLPMSRPPSRLFPTQKVTPTLARRQARPQLDF
ncbi:uncharacterized protein LOC127872979 isoform X1 [Dreissena polymorpha]|uniref:uncharacterized protein LOC127872979 isoform X1 n=1 Tax=Dreissena polymorpha TaxID=45954 RepID=UPI00226435D6|nr:uncharacterized protein LOC127872979 isoform X1 [Dreissena polymorpha]